MFSQMKKVATTRIKSDTRFLQRFYATETIFSLPVQFLRASDSTNYDSSTHQRIDVPFDNVTGKPGRRQKSHYSIESVSIQDDNYNVVWDDGKTSRYSVTFIENQLQRLNGKTSNERILWHDMTEEKVRDSSILSLTFSDLITDHGMKVAVRSLYQYGVLLVTETPINDNGAGVAALGAALGGGSKKELASNSILFNYQKGGDDIRVYGGERREGG